VYVEIGAVPFIRIPADLAKHLDITENSKIEMIPLGKKRFLVELK
jgi:antitoxin component of MazEF toxin-antitoxin module